MKLKLKLILGLGLLACAGLLAAFAVASPTGAVTGTTTDSTTSSTTSTTAAGPGKGKHGDKPPKAKDTPPKPDACRHLDLKGSDGSGSVTFTVVKAGRQNASLVGQQVTLTIPAGSALKANVCMDAAGALTLRDLKVQKPRPTPPAPPAP
jgi:hypothetical protein